MQKKQGQTVQDKFDLVCGSPSWTRTNDPAVNSRMLYRLSYRGILLAIKLPYYTTT